MVAHSFGWSDIRTNFKDLNCVDSVEPYRLRSSRATIHWRTRFETAIRGFTALLRSARPSYFGETHILPLVQQFRRGHPELIVDLRLSDRYTNIADASIDLTIRMGELEDFKINLT